jgi:hypothetical protein
MVGVGSRAAFPRASRTIASIPQQASLCIAANSRWGLDILPSSNARRLAVLYGSRSVATIELRTGLGHNQGPNTVTLEGEAEKSRKSIAGSQTPMAFDFVFDVSTERPTLSMEESWIGLSGTRRTNSRQRVNHFPRRRV